MNFMSSSKRPVHRLIVDAPEPGLGVLVIDDKGDIVARCADEQSRIEIELPRGLYMVRSTRSGAFTEIAVRLDRPQTVKAAVPPVFSAATIPGAETTHEYYTYPAWETSQTATAPEQAWNGAADASLLLFARAPQREVYEGGDQLASLSLRTLEGRTLSSFGTDAKRDNNGWSAYSARLSHGMLILEDLGELPRQVPVPLMRGIQTQLFLMHHKRLLWEDMRLCMVPEQMLASRRDRDPYNQYDEDVRAALDMDTGLLALQNDALSVAPQLIQSFLESKFKNPILGLIGAYLMLSHDRYGTKPLDSRQGPKYIREVLDNLHLLLPESADVVALRLLAKKWFKPFELKPITQVPLFRCGAEVLLHAAATDPSLLPKGSLLDLVSENLCADTVWTTWKPIALPLGQIGVATAQPSWVEFAVVDAIAASPRGGDTVAADDLVRRIGVSPHAVRTAMESLMARVESSLLSSRGEHLAKRMLSSDLTRTLPLSVGTGLDVVNRMRTALASAPRAEAAQKPSMQRVYARLKKALSEFAGTQVGKITADTLLTEIIGSEDEFGRSLVGRRIARQFRDYSIALMEGDLGAAQTVRDLAKLMARKASE